MNKQQKHVDNIKALILTIFIFIIVFLFSILLITFSWIFYEYMFQNPLIKLSNNLQQTEFINTTQINLNKEKTEKEIKLLKEGIKKYKEINNKYPKNLSEILNDNRYIDNNEAHVLKAQKNMNLIISPFGTPYEYSEKQQILFVETNDNTIEEKLE